MFGRKNVMVDVWKRINKKGEDGCWEWFGNKRSGYGLMKIKNIYYSTHRLVYELIYGKIPEGLCVLHRCDNRSCCNPTHLFLGTKLDNSNDMICKKREYHPPINGEKNGNSKLNIKQVREIRKKYSTGNYSQRLLAKEYSVHRTNIEFIVNNKTWRHIL